LQAPAPGGVVAQIAAVAADRPEAVAVQAGCERLSYVALEARANRLAHYLRARGVGPEVPVGICLDRSIARIVAKLAVLKAGGAFVPFDPHWPEARLRCVLDKGQIPVLIGAAHQAEALGGVGRIVVVLERDEAEIDGCPATPSAIAIDA